MRENPKKNMPEGRFEGLLEFFYEENVRCPAGCTRFVDDENMRLLSAKHFIAKVDPSFRSFRANGKLFQGARPQWPDSQRTSFGMFVQPGIIRTKTDGLSFLVCSAKCHSMENTSFVHVPSNPCLKAPINEPCSHAATESNDEYGPKGASPCEQFIVQSCEAGG